MPLTLRARFVIANVAFCALSVGGSAVLCHTWVGMALERHHDDQLHESAERVMESLAGKPLDRATVADTIRSSGVESNLTTVLVWSVNRELIYESPTIQGSAPPFSRNDALVQATTVGVSERRFLTLTLRDRELVRFVSVPIRAGEGHVQVGIVLGDVNDWLHSVELWSVVLIPLFLALTSLAAWIVADRVLRPAER